MTAGPPTPRLTPCGPWRGPASARHSSPNGARSTSRVWPPASRNARIRRRPPQSRGCGADVAPEDLDVRSVYLGQEPKLQVGGDHAPGRADHIGQPPGDRPSAPADLQAPRALTDFKTLNAPLREQAETLLQQLKTARLVQSGMRERIVRSLTHSQDHKPRYASPPATRQPLTPNAESHASQQGLRMRTTWTGHDPPLIGAAR